MRTREIDRLLALADRLTEKGACGAALAILRVAEKAQVEREPARGKSTVSTPDGSVCNESGPWR
jgi:hypothetical protein